MKSFAGENQIMSHSHERACAALERTTKSKHFLTTVRPNSNPQALNPKPPILNPARRSRVARANTFSWLCVRVYVRAGMRVCVRVHVHLRVRVRVCVGVIVFMCVCAAVRGHDLDDSGSVRANCASHAGPQSSSSCNIYIYIYVYESSSCNTYIYMNMNI